MRILAPVLLGLVFAAAAAGCNVSDDIDKLLDLPEATQTGEHTFGCKVDGKNWKPYAEHTLDRAIEPEYSPRGFTVRLENEIGDIPYIYLSIVDTTGLKERTYRVHEGFEATVTKSVNDSLLSDDLSTHDSDLVGYVTITKVKQPTGKISDPGILSGTFSFNARSWRTGRTVQVTEGRFDFALR